MRDEVDDLVDAWARERGDLDLAPVEVFSRIGRLARHLDLARKSAFAAHGIESWEFDVLAALRRAGDPYELSPGRLLRETLVTSGTMTNRVDRLTARGFVERLPDPHDRRGVLVRLTPEGKVGRRRCLRGAARRRVGAARRPARRRPGPAGRAAASPAAPLQLISPPARRPPATPARAPRAGRPAPAASALSAPIRVVVLPRRQDLLVEAGLLLGDLRPAACRSGPSSCARRAPRRRRSAASVRRPRRWPWRPARPKPGGASNACRRSRYSSTPRGSIETWPSPSSAQTESVTRSRK